MPKYRTLSETSDQLIRAGGVFTTASFAPFVSKNVSPPAKYNNASHLVERLEKAGVITRLKRLGETDSDLWQRFYKVTSIAGEVSGRKHFHVPRNMKIRDVEHDFACFTIRLGFVMLFPDWIVSSRTPSKNRPMKEQGMEKGIAADAIISMESISGLRRDFILEVERSRTELTVTNEKIAEYEKISDLGKHGLHPKTRILFVMSRGFHPKWMRCDFDNLAKKELETSLAYFENFMRDIKSRNLKHNYLFAHYSDVDRLDKTVFRDKNNAPCKLVS